MERRKDHSKITTGIDIHIDNIIEETCKVANSSTNTTRSILYAIVVISVLSFIAFWNSRTDNWLSKRIDKIIVKEAKVRHNLTSANIELARIDTLLNRSSYANAKLGEGVDTEIVKVSCEKAVEKLINERSATLLFRDSLDHLFKELHDTHEKLTRLQDEYIMRIHIPILGTTADINDLGIISGVSFSILLFILIFTLDRENNNLKLAFIAITDRYSDLSDTYIFKDIYPSMVYNASKNSFYIVDDANGQPISTEDRPVASIEDDKGTFYKFVKTINLIRRQHHYNYLSMNEIFTLPTLSNNYEPSRIKKVLTYFIAVPPIGLQTVILINDYITRYSGFKLDASLTLQTLIMDAMFLVIIAFLTFQFLLKKYHSNELWDEFYQNNYRYVPGRRMER